MSIEERDNAMCKKLGWPTVTEQKAHWDKQDRETIIATLQALTNTTKALAGSVEGLLQICHDQQQQINNIKRDINLK